MITTSRINRAVLTLLPLFFLACSPAHTPRLADEPGNEPIVQPLPEGSEDVPSPGDDLTPPPDASTPPEDDKSEILSQYDYLDPDHIVPTKALEQAVLYYDQNKTKIGNTKVLSIIDFSQSSTQKRWYIINMETGSVWNIHVSHGKGSDSNHDGFAEKFSNVSGSNASSLGFYLTAETYSGNHGYSLRLDGLSETNSRARSRAIVVHGADYVQEKAVIQGRSLGCPAVSMANRTQVINLIKGGSLILAVN